MPIPGMRGADHVGFTVPDLDEAETFLVEVLGARAVFRGSGKRDDEGDWMTCQLGVSPRTAIKGIRLYRLGNGTNLEVFAYDPPEGQAAQPKNSDIGGHHIALYVDDLDLAIAYLKAANIEVMGEAMSSSGPALGQRWIYFRSPWGMQFELVSYPDGKDYEAMAPVKLWHPARPAE